MRALRLWSNRHIPGKDGVRKLVSQETKVLVHSLLGRFQIQCRQLDAVF